MSKWDYNIKTDPTKNKEVGRGFTRHVSHFEVKSLCLTKRHAMKAYLGVEV